ncbi:MAG: undecaprenyl-diphosphate phosphatase [Alphaproteobacteria bacterium]|nr:undecaprenyl-diphosphate phosphatase [Alphaproteobacteria bacterium]
MTLLQLVVLAAVQGVTEFLPVSSSGHLILVPAVVGWPDQTLLVDIAVHLGTLVAVVLYFWRDVAALFAGIYGLARGRRDPSTRLVAMLIVGTIPVVAAGGILVALDLTDQLRNPEIIAWATLGFGVVLYVADRLFLTVRKIEQMTLGHSAVIGLAQILSLVPGTSRSGITMTAARMLGFERSDAARFSMLLSIPTILAAGLLVAVDAVRLDSVGGLSEAFFTGVLAFGFALLSIAALLAWLKRATFAPFAIYRVVLGAALLVWIYRFDAAGLS